MANINDSRCERNSTDRRKRPPDCGTSLVFCTSRLKRSVPLKLGRQHCDGNKCNQIGNGFVSVVFTTLEQAHVPVKNFREHSADFSQLINEASQKLD